MCPDLVSVKEGEAIAASPELGHSVIAGPVLVAAEQVGEEALVLVRTAEVIVVIIFLPLLLTPHPHSCHQHQG